MDKVKFGVIGLGWFGEKHCEALASLLGELEQVPPMYSAVKHRGRPLYHYARKGQEVARKSRSCLLYTSPSPRDRTRTRMPSSA